MSSTKNPKYRPFPAVKMTQRTWPDRTIDRAPIWCSVDLRDGNQALAVPMSVEEKLEYFDLLVKLGFKEIEIGFPSASQIEFDFTRRLVEEKRIPDDVWVQMLVQSKEELIARTFESIEDCPRAIVHLYNSTSPAQRRITFGLGKKEVVEIAVRGTRQIRALADAAKAKGTHIRFQYSPESFFATEVDFALEICEAVAEAWGPTKDEPIIFNLPSTVEMSTPNHYADMIEWFITHQKHPERAIISLHTHNDRGTGIAASELGLMAGATRVEGTLFGNGERTGNVDIVALALNMQTQGVDPKLDFSRLPEVREAYERWTKLDVPLRWPYAGDLVFTAFSGSHQDAINKGLKDRQVNPDLPWEVPYLSIDHPHQQPVGQGRGGLRDGAGIRLRAAEGDASRFWKNHQRGGRPAGGGIAAGGYPGAVQERVPGPRGAAQAGRHDGDAGSRRDGASGGDDLADESGDEGPSLDGADQRPGQRAGRCVCEGADRERRGAVRSDVVCGAFAGQRRGGTGGRLFRDQAGGRSDDLRRGDEHEYRAGVAEGDPECVESAGLSDREVYLVPELYLGTREY
jgi:isopropylmalate/homocitrate/citramalate synthase